MTITYRTGNPVGSTSPKDLYDNASTFDELVNIKQAYTENRVGEQLLTLYGQRQMADEAIRNIGYIRIGDYDSGPLLITLPNQVFSKDGEFWIAKPTLTLPYTTVENWAVDQANFNSVGDALLRQDLASVGGAGRVLYTPEGTGAISRSVEARLRLMTLPGDFTTEGAALAATMANPNKFYLNNRAAFTITVGAGGDFPTINAAVDAAVRARPTHSQGNTPCLIRLRPGFVMQEQLIIADGSDLGWLRIVADDAMVTIDPAYITMPLSFADDSYPAFGAIANSVLPVIGCLFQYVSNAAARDGVAVMEGSKVAFMPGAGVVRSRRGLLVFYNSEAHCYPLGLTQGGDGTGAGTATGIDFSYARMRGLHVAYGSRASLGRSKLHHCEGDFGAYVIWNCQVDLYQSDASYCTNGTAFHVRDGGSLNCRESNGARSKRGFHALHGAKLNARSRTSGPTMIWVGEGAQYCTEYGVLASNCSEVEASDLNASFCTGSAGISASDTSRINFSNGLARNCAIRGVWAQQKGGVSAQNSDVSGSQLGFVADGKSEIAAKNATANNCAQFGALATGGSGIDLAAATLRGCARGFEVRDTSDINARGADISNCTDRACSAIDGGTANVQEANLSGAGLRAITARYGARVCAVGADCSGAGSWAVEVLLGSWVTFNEGNAGTSPVSQAYNTLTSNGVIFF